MQAIQSVLDKTLSTDTLAIAPIVTELKIVIAKELAPKVADIDLKGEYPQNFMRQTGTIGSFGQAVPTEFGGAGEGVKAAIQVIEVVSQECLSTGFITWCQIACAWYIQNSDNEYLKQYVLPQVATGQVLAGTGLSNPMKHFAGIEKIALVAERCSGGYVINGMLPWVSNIGPNRYFAIAAKIANQDEYLMAIVSDNFAGLNLRCNAHFIALEGSNTFSCMFKNVFVPDKFILAAPCEDYVTRIRPGFVLTQVGMGLGLVTSCIEIMQRANQRLGHVNCFLDDQVENLEVEIETLRVKTYALANEIKYQHRLNQNLKEAIQARIEASELSLRAANAAMLHAGARAYVHGSTVERKLRESYFVAIVTPALKHLKKMLNEMKDISLASPLEH